MPDDGLKPHERELLRDALAAAPCVERAVLYGSRALGTWRRGSDIDLAVEGEGLSEDDIVDLLGRLEELPLPYLYDLTDRARLTYAPLAEHIDQHGQVFWERRSRPESRQSPSGRARKDRTRTETSPSA